MRPLTPQTLARVEWTGLARWLQTDIALDALPAALAAIPRGEEWDTRKVAQMIAISTGGLTNDIARTLIRISDTIPECRRGPPFTKFGNTAHPRLWSRREPDGTAEDDLWTIRPENSA